MAFIEYVTISPVIVEQIDLTSRTISWQVGETTQPSIPHIFFSDGEPWREANAWMLERSESSVERKTLISNANHLKAYASWLENNDLDWRHFPRRKGHRCLFRFRGHLVRARDAAELKPSTVTARMASVVHFYRWAHAHGFIDGDHLWEDKKTKLSFVSSEGLSGTLTVQSSELRIPNRQRPGTRLEGGLLPLNTDNRKHLISFLSRCMKTELMLMAVVSSYTGARSETLRTLRVANIENAIPDPDVAGVMLVPVGPGTGVKTKFGVSGDLRFPRDIINILIKYAYSPRRIMRQSKANKKDKGYLFLTNRGKPYGENSFTSLISHLRRELVDAGLGQFSGFKWHQLRATYGTQLMRYALSSFENKSRAIEFVRDAMFHKDEKTTWTYVKFIEEEPVKEALSEEFFRAFTGENPVSEILLSEVLYENG